MIFQLELATSPLQKNLDQCPVKLSSDLSRLSKVYPGDISLLSNCSCFVGLHSLTQTPRQAQGAGEDRAVYHGGESRAVVLFPTT